MVVRFDPKVSQANAAVDSVRREWPTHTVSRGETPGGIARQYGVSDWRDIMRANQEKYPTWTDDRTMGAGWQIQIPVSVPVESVEQKPVADRFEGTGAKTLDAEPSDAHAGVTRQAGVTGQRAAADTAALRRRLQHLLEGPVETPEQARELTSAVRRLGIRLRMKGETDAAVRAELDNLGKRALAALGRDSGLTLERQVADIDGRQLVIGLDARGDGPLSPSQIEIADLGRRLVYDLNRLADCPQKLDDQTVYLFGLRDALLRRALHLPDRNVPSLPQSFDSLDQASIQEMLGTVHELMDDAPDLPANLLADLGDITMAAVKAPEGGIGASILDALPAAEVGTPAGDAAGALRNLLDESFAPTFEVPDTNVSDLSLSVPDVSGQVGEIIEGYAESLDGVRGGLPPTLPFEYFTPVPIEWVNPDDGSVFRLAAGTGIGQAANGDYLLRAPGLELGAAGEWSFVVQDGVVQLGDSLDVLALGGMQVAGPDVFAELTGVTAQIDRKNRTALVAAEGGVINLASGSLEFEQATVVYGPTGDVAAAVRSFAFDDGDIQASAENVTLSQTIVDGMSLTTVGGEKVDLTTEGFTLQAGTLNGTLQDGDWLLEGTDVAWGWDNSEVRGDGSLRVFETPEGGAGLELRSDNLEFDWSGGHITSTGPGGRLTILQGPDGSLDQLEVISPDFTFGDGDPSHAVHATGAAVNLVATDTGHLLTGNADTFSYGDGALNLTGVQDLEADLTGDTLTRVSGEIEGLDALDGRLSANAAAVDLRFNEDGTLARAAASVGSLDWRDGDTRVTLRDGASMSIDQSSPGKILVDASVGRATGVLDGTSFDVLSGSGTLAVDEVTGVMQLTAGVEALVVQGDFGRLEVAEGATVNLLAVDGERIELEAVVGTAHAVLDDGTVIDIEDGKLNILVDETNGVTGAQLALGHATLASTELGTLVMADNVKVDLLAQEGVGVRLDASAGSLKLERDGHRVSLTEATALLEVDEVAGTTRLTAEVGTALWQSPDGYQVSGEGLALTINEKDGRLTTFDASLAKGALSGAFGESQLDGGVDGVTIQGEFSEDGTRLASLQANAGHIDLTSIDAFGRKSTLSLDGTQFTLTSSADGIDALHFESSAAGQLVLDGRTVGIDTQGKPFTLDARVDNGRLTSVAADLPGRYTMAGEGQEFWLENAHGALTENNGRTNLTAGFDSGGVVLDGLVGNANGVGVDASTSETDAHVELTVGELFLKDTSLDEKYFGGEVEIIGVRMLADVTDNAAHGRVEIEQLSAQTSDARVLLKNPEGRVFALDVDINQEGGGSQVRAGWELVEGGTIQLFSGDDTDLTFGGHTASIEIHRAPGSDTSTITFDSEGLDVFGEVGDAQVRFDSDRVKASLVPEGILLDVVDNATLELQLDGIDVNLDIAAINNQLASFGESESTVNGRPMKVAGVILHPPEGEDGQISASVVVDYEGMPIGLTFDNMQELRAFVMAGDNMVRATISDPSGRGNAKVTVGDFVEAEGSTIDALVRYKQFNAHEFLSELGLLLKNDGVEYLPGLRIDDANKLMHLGVRGSDDSKFGAHALMTVRFAHDPNDPPIYAMTNTHPTGHTEMSAVIKAGLHGNTGKRMHRASFYVGAGQAAALDFMVLEGNMKLLGRDMNSASLPANFFFGVGYSTESAKSRQAINIGGFHNTVGELLEESQPEIFHERVTGGGYVTAEHTDKERQQTFRLGVVSGVDNEGEHAGTWVNVGFTKRFAGARRQRLSVDSQAQDVRQVDWLRGELPGAEPAPKVTPAVETPIPAPATSSRPRPRPPWGEVRAEQVIRVWNSEADKRTRKRAMESAVTEAMARGSSHQAELFGALLRAGLFEEGVSSISSSKRRDLLGPLMIHGDLQLAAAAMERACGGNPAYYERVRVNALNTLARQPQHAERAAVLSAAFLNRLGNRNNRRGDSSGNISGQRRAAEALLQRALRSAQGLEAMRAVMRSGHADEAIKTIDMSGSDRDALYAKLAAADARALAADESDGQVFRLLGARMADKGRAAAFATMLDGLPADSVPVMLASLEPKACEELLERLEDDKDWRGLGARIPADVRAEVVALLHNPRLRAAHLATLASDDATATTRFAIGQGLRAIKVTHGVWVHVPPHLSDRLRDPVHARAVLDAVVEVEKQIRSAKQSGRGLDADVDLVLHPVGFTDHDPGSWDLDANKILQRRPLIAAQLAAVNLRLQGSLPTDLLNEDPELRRGLINLIDFVAAQPETLRQHGVAALRIGDDVGGWFSSEAKVRAYELGKDAAGNEQVVGVLEVDDSVLRGFAAPEGSKDRNKAIEQINEPIREEEDAKLLSLNLTAPAGGTDDEVRGALRVSPFGEKGPSVTVGSDVTGDESVGLGYHRNFEVGDTDVSAFAGLVHADDELAVSVGVKARRLIWQTDNDFLGTFGSVGVAVGDDTAPLVPFARVGLHGQVAGKAGMLQFELAADPLSLRPVFWEVEYQTKFSEDQKVWALVKFNSVIGPAAGIGIKGTEVAIGPLGIEIGPDGGRKLILTIVPPFIYLHGHSVELSRRYLGPFPDIGSLKPRGMSHLPPEVVDSLFEDHMAANGIVAGAYEIRKTIEDYHLGHQMVAFFAAIEEGQPGAERALQSWLNEVRVATLIDRYLVFHKKRPELDDEAVAKTFAASTGGRTWAQASESERQQFLFYVQKSENWKTFSEKFAGELDDNEAAVIPALERYRAAVVGQNADAQQVQSRIEPVAANDRLGILGALAESRKAVSAARARLHSFDAEVGRTLARAGDDREVVQKMRADVRGTIAELDGILDQLETLSRRERGTRAMERSAERLADIEQARQRVLVDLSRLLAGTGERPTRGMLIGGTEWEEQLFELQERGRDDLVKPLNIALWQLKRDPTLWALVQPAS